MSGAPAGERGVGDEPEARSGPGGGGNDPCRPDWRKRHAVGAQEPPPPIATEFLTGRAVFSDDVDLKFKIKLDGEATQVVNAEDPPRTVVARFTVQPGAQFPWHSHAGPVVVNMIEGELVYVDADGCVEHAYPAGTAFVDPGHGHVHSAFNPTDEVTVFVATFFEAPAEGPLLIPAEAPADCTL